MGDVDPPKWLWESYWPRYWFTILVPLVAAFSAAIFLFVEDSKGT